MLSLVGGLDVEADDFSKLVAPPSLWNSSGTVSQAVMPMALDGMSGFTY